MAEVNIPSTVEDPNYRYKMPRVIAKVEGRGNGVKTNIVNMGDIARALKRPPEYCTKFCGAELGAQNKFDPTEGKAIVNGSHKGDAVQTILDKFIQLFVTCPKCGLPEVDMYIKRERIVGRCNACGENVVFDQSHKVVSYIVKNPPKEASTLGSSKKGSSKREHVDDAPAKIRAPKSTDEDSSSKKKKKETSKKKDGEKRVKFSSEEMGALLGKAKEALAEGKSPIEAARALQSDEALTDSVVLFIVLDLSLPDELLEADLELAATAAVEVADGLKDSKLLSVFDSFVALRRTSFLPKYPLLLKLLYSKDIVEEDGILEHYKPSERAKVVGFAEARQAATPFVQWLQEAETESDSGSDNS
eukprot:Polyplicarium_translucidae@DN1141_c0_g1_i1.p1